MALAVKEGREGDAGHGEALRLLDQGPRDETEGEREELGVALVASGRQVGDERRTMDDREQDIELPVTASQPGVSRGSERVRTCL